MLSNKILALDIGNYSTKIAISGEGMLKEVNFLEPINDEYKISECGPSISRSAFIPGIHHEKFPLYVNLLIEKYLERYNYLGIDAINLALPINFLSKYDVIKSKLKETFKIEVKIVPQSAAEVQAIRKYMRDYKDFYVLDIGFENVLLSEVKDGILSSRDIKVFEGEGTVQIATSLQSEMKDILGEISLQRINQILEEDSFISKGNFYSFSKELKDKSQEYLKTILKVIGTIKNLKYSDMIVLLGGGCLLFNDIDLDFLEKRCSVMTIKSSPEYLVVKGLLNLE